MMPQLNKESLSVFYNTKNSFTDKFITLGTTSFHRTWLPNPCKRLMEVLTAIQKNNCSKNFRKFTPRQPYVSVSTKVYSFATFLRTRCVRNKLENR